jgi:hypothetical protein
MNLLRGKFYKPILVLMVVALLGGASVVQKAINRDRQDLGLAKVDALDNAPPALAFTTVALGGFRGLIANALWIRASELQDEDKVFEMVQLADWITKLEPHFVQVWLVQGWNMAYNISVKFNSPEDRWRWVQRGIELLRDDGLRYNPDETLIYRELSWFFQHKMGQNLDDAHWHYKLEWYKEMTKVLGKKPKYDELLNPQTPEAKERTRLLREKYKMDPQIMKEIDERYGPLEWRLPDAHAIYWAEVGRRRGKKQDQERLLRSIYQTMQMSFRRGAIHESTMGGFTVGPNLDIIPNVNKSYEEPMSSDDPDVREQPERGHKNFLKDVVYYLYIHHRRAEAQLWYDYLRKRYPTAVGDYVRGLKALHPNAQLPENPNVEEYTLIHISEDVLETDPERTTSNIEGLIQSAYISYIEDDDALAAEMLDRAEQIWVRYRAEISGAEKRVSLPEFEELRDRTLNYMLNPENGLAPEAIARLRTKLNLPPPVAAPTNPAP